MEPIPLFLTVLGFMGACFGIPLYFIFGYKSKAEREKEKEAAAEKQKIEQFYLESIATSNPNRDSVCRTCLFCASQQKHWSLGCYQIDSCEKAVLASTYNPVTGVTLYRHAQCTDINRDGTCGWYLQTETQSGASRVPKPDLRITMD